MANLDRAIKLLEHYGASKRRKGVELMAKSCDPEAIRHLAIAYKTEPDPEVRALIQKTGRALKLELKLQSANGTPHTDTSRSSKSIFMDSTPSASPYSDPIDYGERPKAKAKPEPRVKREPVEVNYSLNRSIVTMLFVITGIAGVGMFVSMLLPWVDLSSFPNPDGTTMGEEMAYYRSLVRDMQNPEGFTHQQHQQHVDQVDAMFDPTDIVFILNGGFSFADKVFHYSYLTGMVQAQTGKTFYDNHINTYESELDNSIVVGPLIGLIVLLVCLGGLSQLLGLGAYIYGGGLLMYAAIKILGPRGLLIAAILFSIPIVGASIFFYMDGIHRFVAAAMQSWIHIVPEYSALSIMGPGFLLALISGFGGMLCAVLALTFWPIEESYR